MVASSASVGSDYERIDHERKGRALVVSSEGRYQFGHRVVVRFCVKEQVHEPS